MGIATCSGQHKERLFVGEGNFSYTEAFIRKHDAKAGHDEESSLAHSITATEVGLSVLCDNCQLEIQDRISLEGKRRGSSATSTPLAELCASLDSLSLHSEEESKRFNEIMKETLDKECLAAKERVEELKRRGVKILLDVDATSMSTHEKLEGKKFFRIHWNCPHDGRNYNDQTLPTKIVDFFKQCRKMQDAGDRIHITLAQPAEKKGFYQGYCYNIVHAAKTGYALIKKRKFGNERYDGYQHKMTNYSSGASDSLEMREFVFEKISTEQHMKCFELSLVPNTDKKSYYPIKVSKLIQSHSNKECKLRSGKFYQEDRLYYDCSSDEDSSDCELDPIE